MVEIIGWLLVILILSPFIAVVIAFSAGIFMFGCAFIVGIVSSLTGK